MMTLPGTLTRGDVYCLADGSYGSYTFNTADSGTTTSEIRKAQSYDSTCSGLAGWNTSTMGSSQAVFSGTIAIEVSSDYFTINGEGLQADGTPGCGGQPSSYNASGSAATTPLDCGIRMFTTDTSGSSIVVRLDSGSTNFTVEYVEGVQTGTNNPGSNAMFAEFGGNSGFLANHIFGRNSNCEYFSAIAFQHEVKNSYFWWIQSSPNNCHPEAYLMANGGSNTSSTLILDHGNFYRDMSGTSTFATVSSGTIWMNVWDDVFTCSSGGCPGTGNDDGIWWCGNAVSCHVNMYQNTAANINGGADNKWLFCETTGSCSGNVVNNLVYEVQNATGISITQNHNTWLNSPGDSGTANVNVSSGAANPFVSTSTFNFNLAAESSNYNNRSGPLGSPYDTDAAGNAFTSDRGAFQFISGDPTADTPSCTPGAGSYSSAQSVTCSTGSSGAIMCYTTNGSTPVTNGISGCTTGTLYSGAISVTSSLTLQVVAGGTGFLDSSVFSAAYTITLAGPNQLKGAIIF
jgi:hypothetical protein